MRNRLIEESALDKIKGAWGIGWGKTKEVGSGIKLKMDESGVTDKMKTAGSYTWDKTKAAGGYIADKTVEIKNNPKVQGAAGSTKSAAGKAGEAIKGVYIYIYIYIWIGLGKPICQKRSSSKLKVNRFNKKFRQMFLLHLEYLFATTTNIFLLYQYIIPIP